MAEMFEVKKGAEKWLHMEIARIGGGVEIYVKADPRVEEFVKGLTVGKDAKKQPIEQLSKMWVPSSRGGPLFVYPFDKNIGQGEYTLDNVGGHLFSVNLDGVVNLSFLRFVGISDGVWFRIEGPHSREGIRSAGKSIITAARMMFRDYIVPMHMTLSISTAEI